MRLYLVRHGIAIDRDDPESPPEAERYLTREGIARTKQAMEGLRSVVDDVDAMLTSPYVRAAQTARIAAEAWDLDPESIRTTEALIPEAEPKELVAVLSKLRAKTVACFGHAPNLDEVLAAFVGAKAPFTEMKKAGAAHLEMSEAKLGGATLVALYPSGSLRKLN
jgi:phosphohistidine phosphatase